MTTRGWWILFVAGLTLLVGLLRSTSLLIVPGLALLLWIGWEWLFFSLRVRTLLRRLRIERQITDPEGRIVQPSSGTLWAGREYIVTVSLHLDREGWLPFVFAADSVPFGAQHQDGPTTTDGQLRPGNPLELSYRIHCPLPGVARFEGLRLELSDLQGFFAHITFLRAPVEQRILPAVLGHRGGGPTVKRHNELPPPGIHRLKRPGSGSELLDLRDYLPGDPPRTIAWKVSARRDRLITKEFESEVPVRCTLFVDVSSSVRVPSPTEDEKWGPGYFKPLDRLIDLSAGVIQASAALRDLTGLCLFDELAFRIVPPERTSNHRNRLLQLLGEAAARGPVAAHADAEQLLPIGYALAQEVYPDLLHHEVNRMPAWFTWLVGFPGHTRHYRGILDLLNRRKRALLLWGTTLVPLTLLAVNIAGLVLGIPDWALGVLGGLLFYGVPVVVVLAWLVFLGSLVFSGKQRRFARWRKRLAALFAAGVGQTPPMLGKMEALLEDDDLFSLHLQQFLAEHQVPCAVPLYDAQGRYLFALPSKVEVLSRALLQAVHRGRDNELYVLLADLLELDDHLSPLLQAVRVALGRHHQVMVVCPWPQDVPLPGEEARRKRRKDTVAGLILSLSHGQIHSAYERIRRVFARLGVQVVCAASDAPIPLILERIERIRSARSLIDPGRS